MLEINNIFLTAGCYSIHNKNIKNNPESLIFLLQGKIGTGKEVFAREIHKTSRGKGKFIPLRSITSFIAVNYNVNITEAAQSLQIDRATLSRKVSADNELRQFVENIRKGF